MITLALGRGRMPKNTASEESDFQAWLFYATQYIAAECGFEVDVVGRAPADEQNDEARGESIEARLDVLDARDRLWNEWLEEESQWADVPRI